MDNESQPFSLSADRLGIIASALCFVHCILTPVVLSLSAVWAHYLPSDERIHRALAVIVAGIGCFAIVRGYRKHRRLRVLSLMGTGLACIFSGAYFGNRLPSHLAEVAVTMLGSSLMIAAHLINHTFCRNCRNCDKI
jgi:uncharacterized membrane protein YfcA